MARPEFDGTNLAAEHIGKRASDNIHASFFNDASEYVDLELSIGAEAAQTIPIAVQAKTRGGENLAQPVQLLVRIHDANLLAVAATAGRVAATGNATLDTPANQAAGLVTLGADGDGTITIEDETGTLEGDLIVEIEVVGREGVKLVQALTFA